MNLKFEQKVFLLKIFGIKSLLISHPRWLELLPPSGRKRGRILHGLDQLDCTAGALLLSKQGKRYYHHNANHQR